MMWVHRRRMLLTYPHRIGLLADPHFHSTAGSVAPPGIGGLSLRPESEVLASSRLFNESEAAFRAALDGLEAQGVRLTILLGDLTDDGQRADLIGARAVLAEYEARGMRFFMVPGNHDMVGMRGRNLTQGYLQADGVVRLSGPSMRCLGYPEALDLLPGLGFTPETRDLHWETPFGTSPDFEDRCYTLTLDGITHRQIDASYLVEPEMGLWLLSLDANMFLPTHQPQVGAIDPVGDSNGAGWPMVVRHRPYFLAWMTDVAARAERLGKELVCFSHFPMIDPPDLVLQESLPLFGNPVPALTTPDAVLRTGIRRVFTAHLHVDQDMQVGHLVNHAVPSPVSLPAGFKTLGPEGLVTHPVAPVGYPTVYDMPALRDAAGYAALIDAHFAAQALPKLYAREWPEGGPDISVRQMAEDWYRLRRGALIDPGRMADYRTRFGDVMAGLLQTLRCASSTSGVDSRLAEVSR